MGETLAEISPNRLARCMSCGGAMRRTRRSWLYRCEACGLLASDLEVAIPRDAAISQIDERDREIGLEGVRARNNSKILAAVRRHGNGGVELLDVGAGLGFFLRDARAAGFKVLGVEPDGNVVEKARASGVEVRHGFFPDCMTKNEAFDVIVFNDVLEHIPAADAAIAAAADLLRPGGLLAINCPDRNGVFYRLASSLDRAGVSGPFERMWQRDLPSPHVWYFSRRDVVALGDKRSLEFVASVDLATLTFAGLRQRIFYVRGQSLALSAPAFVAASLLIPFLSILPRDIAAVLLRKPAAGDQRKTQ